jgi:hypothetical protein
MDNNNLSSPIFSGFLSSVIRSAPIEDMTSFADSISTGVAKELTASLLEYKPTSLCYQSIFSPFESDRHIPLAPNIDPDPFLAKKIHIAFSRAKTSFHDKILYPNCSDKTVGSVVEQEFWEVVHPSYRATAYLDSEQVDGGVSTSMIQKMEYWTGVQVSGPVEVRTAWKYNDLKPRVYFAQGGDTFATSRYIQKIFNELVDHLEPTHRQNRYLPITGDLTSSDTVIIYDYSSFTSTLDEIHGFLRELSHFMMGTPVHLIGRQDGPVTVDLGELLLDYSKACNLYAQFDIGRGSLFLVLQHGSVQQVE